MGLGPVMSPAQRREVVGPGLARWSAVVHLDVGLDMVEVAVTGVLVAVGEDALTVAQDHQLAHPLGWVVLVDAVGAVHPEHRLQGEPAGAQPLLDGVDGQRAELLDRAERELVLQVGEVEVHVGLGRHSGGRRADQGVERRDPAVVQARLLVSGPGRVELVVGAGREQVHEVVQGRGVADDLHPGGAGPDLALVVVQAHPPGRLGLVLGLGLLDRVEHHGRLGHQPVELDRPARVRDLQPAWPRRRPRPSGTGRGWRRRSFGLATEPPRARPSAPTGGAAGSRGPGRR